MTKYIASLLFSFSLLSAQFTYAEQIYKQIDENGVPSFSDTNSKNAEKIIVEPINVQKIHDRKEYPAPARNNQPEANRQPYTTLAISSPADQATIRNQPTITLTAALEPGLRTDHRIEFLNNGQTLQPASKKTSITLTNFERGEHSLSVRITDRNGKAVQSSSAITVFVFRAVAKPPAPPKKPAAP